MPEEQSHQYFEMIKREHRELGESIAAARKAIEAEPRDVHAVRLTIQHVCQLVESHFAHEEEGGYMQDAILRAPRMSERANVLLLEHEQLLTDMRGLCGNACCDDDTDIPWDDIVGKFSSFVSQLGKHEAEESTLLQEAYITDIGSKD